MAGELTVDRESSRSSSAAARTPVLDLIGRPTSRVGFGTGSLLRVGSARQRERLLAAALASGITHFDTAPVYGFGESERTLGRFLVGRRNQVTLTTKFGLQPSRLAARFAILQRIGRRALQLLPALRRAAVRNAGVLYASPEFAARAITASLEASLRALRTDYVDFFLAHQASVAALPDLEVIGLLEQLRQAGKIRAYGVATDFDWLAPVLLQRPQLSRVIQFDSQPATANAASLAHRPDQLLITYGFIGRATATCQERLRSHPDDELNLLEQDRLGGLLVRASVLANPHGIVLMQSRSPDRIASNVQAACNPRHDEVVQRLLELLGEQR
jgi:D-threo-aldose 1-dehydrogenase